MSETHATGSAPISDPLTISRAHYEQLRSDIQRLREQNKASSDAWTKRTAAMESQIAKTKSDFEGARRWYERMSDKPWWQQSHFGKHLLTDLITERDTLAAQLAALPEWRCPSCGAITRARMANHDEAPPTAAH